MGNRDWGAGNCGCPVPGVPRGHRGLCGTGAGNRDWLAPGVNGGCPGPGEPRLGDNGGCRVLGHIGRFQHRGEPWPGRYRGGNRGPSGSRAGGGAEGVGGAARCRYRGSVPAPYVVSMETVGGCHESGGTAAMLLLPVAAESFPARRASGDIPPPRRAPMGERSWRGGGPIRGGGRARRQRDAGEGEFERGHAPCAGTRPLLRARAASCPRAVRGEGGGGGDGDRERGRSQPGEGAGLTGTPGTGEGEREPCGEGEGDARGGRGGDPRCGEWVPGGARRGFGTPGMGPGPSGIRLRGWETPGSGCGAGTLRCGAGTPPGWGWDLPGWGCGAGNPRDGAGTRGDRAGTPRDRAVGPGFPWNWDVGLGPTCAAVRPPSVSRGPSPGWRCGAGVPSAWGRGPPGTPRDPRSGAETPAHCGAGGAGLAVPEMGGHRGPPG